MMQSAIAGNAKKLIKEKGLKQKAVAEKAGYKEKELSNMLNGRKLITDLDILPLCNGIGCLPNELFGVKEQIGA